jgi:hypothetical protein
MQIWSTWKHDKRKEGAVNRILASIHLLKLMDGKHNSCSHLSIETSLLSIFLSPIFPLIWIYLKELIVLDGQDLSSFYSEWYCLKWSQVAILTVHENWPLQLHYAQKT